MRLMAITAFLTLLITPCFAEMELETAMHHVIRFNVDSQYSIVETAPLYNSNSGKWINQIELHGEDGKNANIVITEFEAMQSDFSLDSIKREKERQIEVVGVGGSTLSNTTIHSKPTVTWHIPRQQVLKGYEIKEIYGYSYWYDNSTKVEVTVNGLGKDVYDDLLKLQVSGNSDKP